MWESVGEHSKSVKTGMLLRIWGLVVGRRKGVEGDRQELYHT